MCNRRRHSAEINSSTCLQDIKYYGRQCAMHRVTNYPDRGEGKLVLICETRRHMRFHVHSRRARVDAEVCFCRWSQCRRVHTNEVGTHHPFGSFRQGTRKEA